ncbi:EAL domain-containing protein [Aeromonas sobria]|uniref:EAL domain-containing protein n=1 Tax=Aeromonas sobria TaxID=646 RepID=UPI000C6D6743|nr:EAL domain-containing protein [Aeromonas sobria]PKQ71926.1 diguanylate phosphodiesterase [Aeromonas sobria]
MPIALPNLDFSRPFLRFLGTGVVFMLAFGFGLWALYSGYLQILDGQSKRAARRTLALVETMLDHAEKANRAVQPFIMQPCEQSLFTLRQQVAFQPFVRTVSLVGTRGIYCNSLFGATQWPDPAESYSDGRLSLFEGTEVRVDHPLLALRANVVGGAAVSTIDGDYLRYTLELSGATSNFLLLHVGKRWLDERGILSDKASSPLMLASHEVRSERYPFSIYAGHDIPSLWLSLWHTRQWAILTLGGLCFSFALLLWSLLGRPRSPVVELSRALRNREFVPYLQPLVATESGRVTGVEVLMRWQHPVAGLIRPDLFIPQAEASGLIVPMTTLLMEEVARELSLEPGLVTHGFHVSFNISAAHCRDMMLLAECRRFLEHFAPGKVVLVLELTERELLVADPQTLSLFRQLDEMGVKLAIDDFGTGHSSLAYLQQFHVDYLKIDQSFIARIGTESLSEHIVDNVIDLATRLGLALVAEGVETERQADYLRAKGVDYLQGYLFARPMPLRQFCETLSPQAERAALPEAVRAVT